MHVQQEGSHRHKKKMPAAKLDKKDWSFSGRKGKSRRTISSSIIKSRMKLRSNKIYSKDQSFL